jgi:hypothetical protein
MYPLLKRKKVSNMSILKRGKRYYEMRVTNQLHKNYLTGHVLYQIPLRTTNVVGYGTLKIH